MEASGICAHTRTDNHPSSAKYLNHSHDSYEIFLLTDGNCTFQVTDSRYHLPHGSLMLFRRGELHRLLPEGNAPLAYGYLQFTREAIPPEPALLEAIDRLFENRQDGCNNLLTPTAASLSFLQMCIRRMSVAASEDPLPLFLCYLRPLIRELLLCGTPLSGEIHRVRTAMEISCLSRSAHTFPHTLIQSRISVLFPTASTTAPFTSTDCSGNVSAFPYGNMFCINVLTVPAI